MLTVVLPSALTTTFDISPVVFASYVNPSYLYSKLLIETPVAVGDTVSGVSAVPSVLSSGTAVTSSYVPSVFMKYTFTV